MKKNIFSRIAVASTVLGVGPVTAWAEEATPAANSAPASTALPQQPLAGPMAANPNPAKFNADPLGDIYVSGIVSGFGQGRSNAVPEDRRSQADVSKGQSIVQKTDGIAQVYVQGGAYSLPSLLWRVSACRFASNISARREA